MSNKKFNIETLASNLMILIVIGAIIGTAFSQQVINTRQFNSLNKQTRLNAQTSMKLQEQQQKLDQRQERYELRTARATAIWNGIGRTLIFLLNSILVLLLLGCVAALVYYLVRLARKSTQSYFEWQEQTKHELKLERELTKRLQYQYQPSKGMFEGLRIAGNLTYNPTTRDSHDLTQQNRDKKALSDTPSSSRLETVEAPVRQIPSFNDLLDLPTPRNHLALGYDQQEQPVYVPITSQAIGGISGSGKSSTLTALCAGLKKQGANIVLCDSHRDSEQGLTNKLAPIIDVLAIDSAESVAECKEAMAWTLDEFNERRTSGNSKDSFSPLIFIADEWLALQRDSDLAEQAEHLAHTLIHEARKFNMHIWIAGQTFKAKHATDAHHAIGQKIIGKMDTKQARMLSGMSADLLPKDTLFLNAGESFLISWNDPTPQKVYTPYADLSGFQSTFNPLSKPNTTDFLNLTQSSFESPLKATETQTKHVTDTNNLTTEQKRLIRLLKQGKSLREIIKEVYQVSSGSKYNQRLTEFTQLIRKQMI